MLILASMTSKHPIPPTRWPTRAEARSSLLFQPLRVGAVTARTRTWVPAMVPWRATAEGHATQALLEWYGRFAAGRPGVLVVEATGIRDVPSGPLLRIGHDRFLPGLRELVEVVRERSQGQTRLFIQIIDFLQLRRRPERERYLAEYLVLRPRHREALQRLLGPAVDLAEASEARLRRELLQLDDGGLGEVLDDREREALYRGARERVTDLHLPHIRALPQTLPPLFAAAARRAREAGFDGVELHYAHAYTMASFLSRCNDRDDGYGGDRPGRVRLALEVLEAVRREVGTGYSVGCRILGDEVIEGGSRIEDACYYAAELARAGMDYLSISKGGKFEDARQPRVGEAVYPYTGTSGQECMPTVYLDGPPFGRNLPLARAIRETLRRSKLTTPVVGAGGINSFEIAERALQEGDCDFVASARQSLADPDWFRKMEIGLGEDIRRCKFTNYCEALDQRHRQVTCQRWDRDFSCGDRGGPPLRSDDGKRRLVAPPWDPPPDS